jgi:hypothetical protein
MRPPLGCHAIKEARVDPSIQLIDVPCIDPALEAIVFSLQPFDCRFVLSLLIRMAGQQRGAHPGEALVVAVVLCAAWGLMIRLSGLVPLRPSPSMDY